MHGREAVLALFVISVLVVTSFSVLGFAQKASEAELMSLIGLQWQRYVTAAIDFGAFADDAMPEEVKAWLDERVSGMSEKSRTKVMRAFDGETDASVLMDGWRVHYDMVRTYQTLGRTPGEAADLPPLEGFEWHELLKLASTRNETADKQQTADTR